MTWTRSETRDPLQIVIEREARTCKGCENEVKTVMFGGVIKTCEKRKKHGKRCAQYVEGGKK